MMVKADQYIVTIVGGTKDQADLRAYRMVPDGYEYVHLRSRRERPGDKTTAMVRTYTFEPSIYALLDTVAEGFYAHD